MPCPADRNSEHHKRHLSTSAVVNGRQHQLVEKTREQSKQMKVTTASFSDEQEQFREILQKFLSTQAPTTEVRRIMASETGHADELWQRLCNELALPGLHLPEACGGSGFGAVELGIAMEELGRALTPSAFFASSVMAAIALLEAASEDQQQSLLPDIISGQRTATLAICDQRGRWTADSLSATHHSGKTTLDGTAYYVVDGMIADDIIVAAHDTESSQLGFYLVTAQSSGIDRQRLQSLDDTRRMALLRFSNSPATVLTTNDAEAIRERIFDQVCVALACEMVGGAQALFDSAVNYAKLRVQFGRTIGSFQAIKHKCADMLLEVESARSAAYVAARAVADSDPQVRAYASLAIAAASEAFINTATQCIQIHGGIGFTWENDTHLWFKRAKVSQQLLGDSTFHRERMLKAWGI
jgi:alkylation response protein AidB-like acyl-CoA dehydrogenase